MNKQKKEDLEMYFKPVLYVVILILVLGLVWIIWKYLQNNFEIKQKILLEKQEKQRILREKKQAELKAKKEYENYIKNLDLESDDSITKFVNNKVSFNNIWYIPKNLVPVSWKHIIDGKWWYIKVRKVLKENLEKMAKDFYSDTNNNLVIVSGYRSYVYQKWIKDRGCPDNLCAKPGYSEHQSWLAIDIYSASSKKNWANNNNLKKYFYWFKQNAYKYGFTNTYQKWIKVDGYEIEPWHWRYVGKKFAKYLWENKITEAEFYYKRLEKKSSF